MNIAALFIRRPIMTTLVMIAFVLFGIIGYQALPVSDLPNIDFPTIVVTGSLPGASPETMAASVATPLERQFSTIAGVDSMSSTSALGSSQITLQFDLSRDIDAAAQDVQSAITASLRQLPTEMPTPPTFRKVNPADQPILQLALSSQTLPLSTVNEYADTFLAQRISTVKGVAQVQVYGAQKYAVRARLNPEALAARSIGLDEVTQAIQKGNVNLPTGTLLGRHQTFTVQASGQLMNAAAYRPLIVAYRNGAPIRLGDLGQIADSVENDRVASWFNGDRAIVLAIQKQPGSNTVEVVDSIRSLLPSLRAAFPASIKIDILFDRSVSIRESVRDVEFTLLLAIILVVLVIFLFLRNLSATIIPSLALPICIVGTFALMYLFGFSLDNLSLMALTLAVGFVVDDAIVMLENIVRHMEKGEKPFDAAMKGSREIGFTIVSMTLSLVAVFIPVLFMGGIVGRMLHEFAITISVAILISGVVSLTLTPMLSSLFLRHAPQQRRRGRLHVLFERFFDGMLNAYDRSLTWVLRFRLSVMVVSTLFLAASILLFVVMPKGFLPSEDTGQIAGFTEAVEGIGFDSMVDHQQAVADLVRANPNVASLMSSVGSGGSTSGTNSGRLMMRLKPRSQRNLNADEVIQQLRSKLSSVPGIQVFLQNPPPISFGGRLTKSQYQYTLQSPDTEDLYKYAPLLEAGIKALPGFQDVTSDLQIKNPQVSVAIDRDKASVLGVTASQVEESLQTAYASSQISTIYAPNNQFRVIVELERKYQANPVALDLLYIRSLEGRLIPLSTVSRFNRSVGPLTITHSAQLPSVTVSFSLANGKSLGDALNEVEDIARTVLPASITGSVQGTAQAFQSSFRGLWVLLLVAILVIYIVLGMLYESFIHPLTILSGLPSAGLGALLTLMLFGIDLNLYALVGIIMLIGIVKKNAIMMIDFALEAERVQGKTPAEAIYQGAITRFRPIMMTTMAALMATLPIALGFGAGSESRRPLGLAVVGGLVFSQVVTLYITPVIYTYLDSAKVWAKGKLGKN